MDNRKFTFLVFVLCSLFLAPMQAQEVKEEVKGKKEEVKASAFKMHLKQHFRFYGFIRNYFTYDSRESYSGTGDLYNYQPKDVNPNAYGDDLNAVSTFRFLSLTTRAGVDIKDYIWRGTEFGGKIEVDFYAGLSTKGTGTHSLSGTAQLRLRQAYMTMAWDSLPIGKDVARVQLTIGQTWHPMAADLADVIALNSGAPFGPFNRSPQVKMDARFGRYVTLTASALWQMQYLSIGPEGQSAEYIAYSKTPEAYLGLSFHHKGFIGRVGADVLSISPRHQGKDAAGETVRVKDRITTASPFLYLQYQQGDFSIKAKTIFAEAGEHMNMNGGYGVKRVNADGSWEYTPTRTSTSWISIVYGGKLPNDSKLQGILFGGYIHNLGTKDELTMNADGTPVGYYYPRVKNMNNMWRLSPTILWTIGKFQLGCEYEITSVNYGTGSVATNGLVAEGLHWVTNHRVQLMTKYNF